MIDFRSMNEIEFKDYKEKVGKGYAKEIAKNSQISLEKAIEIVKKEDERLFPDGYKSKGQHLYYVSDNNKDIGLIWVSERNDKKTAHIMDINVFEDYRCKGYGKKILSEIETKMKDIGIKRLTLHVFGDNFNAKKLYDKVGYIVTDYVMAKEIS